MKQEHCRLHILCRLGFGGQEKMFPVKIASPLAKDAGS